MLRTDIPTMAKQLNLLAEVFDKKPISEGAALVWFDTLKDFKTEKVCSLLIAWPKAHGKFPTPAEVFRVCNEAASSELEAKAQRENKAELEWVRSPRALEFLTRMKATLNKPKRSPLQHWLHVYATKPVGAIGHTYATQTLKKWDKLPETREAGQDDEEHVA